jgi:hypothetical protein
MKKLQGNNKKYFDSGDYNMANKLTKPTLANTPLANKNAIPGNFFLLIFIEFLIP